MRSKICSGRVANDGGGSLDTISIGWGGFFTAGFRLAAMSNLSLIKIPQTTNDYRDEEDCEYNWN